MKAVMTKEQIRRRNTFQETIVPYMINSTRYRKNKDLADALGMSPSGFSEKWNFRQEFRLDEVATICRLLRVRDDDRAKLIV